MNLLEAIREVKRGKSIRNKMWTYKPLHLVSKDGQCYWSSTNDHVTFDSLLLNWDNNEWELFVEKHPKLEYLHTRLLLHSDGTIHYDELLRNLDNYIRTDKDNYVWFRLPPNNSRLASDIALVFSEYIGEHGGVVYSQSRVPQDLVKEGFIFGVKL